MFLWFTVTPIDSVIWWLSSYKWWRWCLASPHGTEGHPCRTTDRPGASWIASSLERIRHPQLDSIIERWGASDVWTVKTLPTRPQVQIPVWKKYLLEYTSSWLVCVVSFFVILISANQQLLYYEIIPSMHWSKYYRPVHAILRCPVPQWHVDLVCIRKMTTSMTEWIHANRTDTGTYSIGYTVCLSFGVVPIIFVDE